MINIRFAFVAFLLALLAACNNKFLERYPISEVSPQTFFNSEADLELYANSFYDYLPDAELYSGDVNSDNVDPATVSNIVSGKTVVPSDAGAAGWTWSALQNINYFLENADRAKAVRTSIDHYKGLAYFFRAFFYIQKVQRFGDVPFYNKSLNEASSELYKPRDSRETVVDSILSDLDKSIAGIKPAKNVSRITRWAALALKSRFCLYEGTYRKYHTELKLTETAIPLLKTSVEASSRLMKEGGYKLYSTGKPAVDYLHLFVQENAVADEFILARVYDASQQKTHAANSTYLTSTLGAPGLTKSMVDSYLMRDGTSFTRKAGSDTKVFKSEVVGRDLRLSQTIRTPGYTRLNDTKKLAPDFTNALTGYQNIKFVMGINQDGYNSNTNDLPIFRYAEVLLNFAEAKAELGTITQADIDQSINLIRKRVSSANLALGGLMADPFLQSQYPLVSDPLILEIRRERRVELAMEGFRLADLMRWKAGALLAQPFQGMYFPSKGLFDLDGDGVDDVSLADSKPTRPKTAIQYYILKDAQRRLSGDAMGRLEAHPFLAKVFDEGKHYLFPLPVSELTLNANLVQNPGW